MRCFYEIKGNVRMWVLMGSGVIRIGGRIFIILFPLVLVGLMILQTSRLFVLFITTWFIS